jgi:DNA transformation protein
MSHASKQSATSLTDLPNIGRKIAGRLIEAGISTPEDLRKIGAVEAHRRIRRNYPTETLAVCYYLYSFEGAIRGCHWNEIGADCKEELKQAIDHVN